MTWMSLPATGNDKYVDPVHGNDGFNGNSWAQAYETCARAAAQSATFGRVWLTPTPHYFTSPISYVFKKLQWIGPPIPGAGFEAVNGSAFFTGAPNSLDYFVGVDPSSANNTFGGGFENIAFDAAAIKTTAAKCGLWLKQTNYVNLENLWIVGTPGSHRNVYLIRPDEFTGTFTGNNDKSWGTVRNCNAQNAGLFLATEGEGELNGWRFSRLFGDTDAPAGATVPYVNVDEALKGAYVDHVYMRNTATNVPAMFFDERGHLSRNRALNFSGIAFADLRPPYHGLELYDTMSSVSFPGGNNTTDGIIWGDSLVKGYMAVPQASLGGSLTTGVN